jgi:hypothetical protein
MYRSGESALLVAEQLAEDRAGNALGAPASWHAANPILYLINQPDARLFTAMSNGCKWNSDDFAMKWE